MLCCSRLWALCVCVCVCVSLCVCVHYSAKLGQIWQGSTNLANETHMLVNEIWFSWFISLTGLCGWTLDWVKYPLPGLSARPQLLGEWGDCVSPGRYVRGRHRFSTDGERFGCCCHVTSGPRHSQPPTCLNDVSRHMERRPFPFLQLPGTCISRDPPECHSEFFMELVSPRSRSHKAIRVDFATTAVILASSVNC